MEKIGDDDVGFLKRLLVLIWRHAIVRVRRYILTIAEFVVPILLFMILFTFKDDINPKPKSFVVDKFNIRNTEPMMLDDFQPPTQIYYHPLTNYTELIMNKTCEQLYPKQQNRRELGRKTNAIPVTDINEFLRSDSILDKNVALVEFLHMEGETWPASLDYTIRMNQKFQTYLTLPQSGEIGPHENFGTVYKEFMRLQWAIDTSYIKLLSGTDIKQRVSLQEFPYVRLQENMAVELVSVLAAILCWMALLLPFMSLLTRLVEEKVSGIQDMLRMVGVKPEDVFASHIINMLPAALVFSVGVPIMLTSTSNPLVRHSSAGLMGLVLALHFFTLVFVAFVLSYAFKSMQYVTSISAYVYAALWLPLLVLPARAVPWLRPLLALLPDVPLQWYWRELAALEKLDMGLTCSNMFDRHDPIGLSAFTCIVAMCVQMLISTMVLVLINAPYMGLKLPCFRLWMRKLHALKVESDGEALEEQGLTPGAEYFEKVPENKEVGIKIVNVSKMYGNQCALKNVSLDVYKGEITVLLGHNGAGKTTLMSIITGMLTPTSGKVFVDGIDIAQGGRRALRQLGLCPQHNLFVPHLTVLEHVVMFTVLKGGSWSTAKESSRELLEQLGIGDKCGAQSEQLSGGMRRRLQLACALAGGSGVLVLDEPTSGLDVETRRGLWDLLLSLRGTRTVVLSTHFMEEADALGERVAALHRGTLRCHATTMHLKRAVGTGYRLSFTTIGYPKEEAVTSVVTSHVPDATLKGKTLNSLTYNLPAKYNAKFPALFSNLETSRPELGIDSIGVGVSTIEEVFLKLCSDSDAMASEDMLDDTTTELQFEKRTGFGLYVQQVVALLWRQLRFVIDKRTSYFLVYFFLPILLTVLITIVSNNESSYDNKERSINLDLDLYDKVSGARILYKVNDTDTLQRVVGAPPFLEPATDLNDAILRIGKSGIKKYSNYLIGIEVNETDAKVWYSTVYLHTAPVGLHLLGRYMAARTLPAAGVHTLSARNWPLAHSAAHVPAVEPKSSVGAVLYSSGIVFSTLATIMNVLPLVIKERAAGTRALHALAGCAPELHWLAAALAHTALYAAPVVLGTVAATAVADADHTFLQADFLGTIALVMLLGLLAFLPVAYLPTFRCGERATTLFLSVFIIVFGIGTPSIRSAIEMFEEKQKHPITWFLMRCADYLAPPHTYMVAATRTALTARVNALCQLNRDRCPNLVVAEPGFDAAACCANEKPRCYFCFEDGSPLSAMLFLVFQVFLYFLVVEVVERGWLCAVWERLGNARYAPRDAPDADDLARAERVYVANAIALPTDLIQDAMLVNDLHKNYACMFRKPCNAVRGVSFSVKKGECFGLLGVNGAGKSTTFKMLTAEVPPTRGSIYANGHHLGFLPDKYVSTLGYCPQHGGLDGALTGREHLALLLALRGLRAPDARAAAREWTAAVGLTAYADRQTRTYSGGCARRLAAAAALCGGADTALLDEPSAGVDVAARRRLWAAVRRALRTKRSLVISSHSMEEMEALCDRIAIMAEGRVRALGAAAALRAAHAAGHAVRVKLRPAARAHGDATDSSVPPTEAQLQQLKSAFRDVFNCTLKDEHTTMLHYHINESMSYSNLFGALEALRGDFPELLEDYSVTETTLEEVFLSFAKEPALEAVVTSQTQPHNV